MINIGIDASGGDNGEKEVLKAIIKSIKINENIFYYIIGDEEIIKNIFLELNFNINNYNIKIIDAKEKISMNDHPVFALRNNRNSSIYVAGELLKNNTIDIFISAGNTGALVALAQLYIKPIQGIDRPVIAALVPTNKNKMLLIDSGCNVDSKPEWLYQYAMLGKIYLKEMYGYENPKIGLLNIGVEENKGNTLTLSTYKLLKENKNLNFIGNVEARDVPQGVCDILIADGFSGNVFLKTYEGTAKMFLSIFKNLFKSNLLLSLIGLCIKKQIKKYLKNFDVDSYGGAPILGANNLIIKCHGNATANDYIFAFNQAYNLINNNINNKIKKEFEV